MRSQQDQEGGVVPGGHEGREKDEVWRFGGPCLVPRHEEAEREGKARKKPGGESSAKGCAIKNLNFSNLLRMFKNLQSPK